jgi:hypothetical protein
MKQRARIYYSAEQKNLMWDRYQYAPKGRQPALTQFSIGICHFPSAFGRIAVR